MYVATIPNRTSNPAYLLRESFREGNKVKNRTLANLSHLPMDVINTIKRALAGQKMVPVDEDFETERSIPAGHVRAVYGTMKRLGIPGLLSTRRSRKRDLVLGMIAERVLDPTSKLGTVRLWGTSTLASELEIEDADVDELYGALDWLLKSKARIEGKLAKRHLSEGGPALYDMSNSLYEGHTCILARLGKDKKGRRGASVIAYGLLTDREGRPVGMDVYPGDTGDPATVPDQVLKIRSRFGLQEVVLVGDRGMLTSARIRKLQECPGLGWISALRTEGVRKLVNGKALQMSLFDERNLAEIRSPDFPGERLVACFNPLLADERRRKRADLLEATEKLLSKISREVARRTNKPLSAGEIGQKVGHVLHRYKVRKHFDIEIGDGRLSWSRKEESIQREADLDGIYVIRTSEPEERLPAEDTVRSYKLLAEVEQAFRCLKGIDLRISPIFHRTEDHVRAHFFMCMLAYYVEWHMRRSLAPLLFVDETLSEDRDARDPVAKSAPSASVKAKKNRRTTPDGFPVHSFETLLAELSTQARVTYRLEDCDMRFDKLTTPTPLQQKAFDLLGV